MMFRITNKALKHLKLFQKKLNISPSPTLTTYQHYLQNTTATYMTVHPTASPPLACIITHLSIWWMYYNDPVSLKLSQVNTLVKLAVIQSHQGVGCVNKEKTLHQKQTVMVCNEVHVQLCTTITAPHLLIYSYVALKWFLHKQSCSSHRGQQTSTICHD